MRNLKDRLAKNPETPENRRHLPETKKMQASTDIESLGDVLMNSLTISEHHHHHQHQQKESFRFSPSSFVAWNYFRCKKQLRLSLEVRRGGSGCSTTGGATSPASSSSSLFVVTDSDTEGESANNRSSDAATIVNRGTTQRGFAFEEKVITFIVKSSQHHCALIDYDKLPDPPPSTWSSLQCFEHLLRSVLAAASANETVFVAQMPLRAPAAVEAMLFPQHRHLVTFSRMKPDLLLFKLSKTSDGSNNKYAVKITIVDIKSSARMKLGHQMQVATYAIVLAGLIKELAASSNNNNHNNHNNNNNPLLDSISDISVDPIGQIWLPTGKQAATASDQLQQQQPKCCWKEATFEIEAASAHVVAFCRDILVPQVLLPGNARRDVDFELSAVCSGCDFKRLCRRDAAKMVSHAADEAGRILGAERCEPVVLLLSDEAMPPPAVDFSSINGALERAWRVASKLAALRHNVVVPLVGEMSSTAGDRAAAAQAASVTATRREYLSRKSDVAHLSPEELQALAPHLTRRQRLPLFVVPPSNSNDRNRGIINTSVFIVWSTETDVSGTPCRVVIAEQEHQHQQQQQPSTALSIARVVADFSGPHVVEQLRQALSQAAGDPRRVFVTWSQREYNLLLRQAFSSDMQFGRESAAGAGEQQQAGEVDIGFFAPRVFCLAEAVSGHVSLPVPGVPELTDVAKWLVVKIRNRANKNTSNTPAPAAAEVLCRRVHGKYQTVNDLGLLPTQHQEQQRQLCATAASTDMTSDPSSVLGHLVARTIAECFRALIDIATDSKSLRPTPASARQHSGQQLHEVTRFDVNTGQHRPLHPARDLFLRSRSFLSWQATGSWLDRGNPASMIIGRFVPNSESPSFCRIQIQLGKNEDVPSSPASACLAQLLDTYNQDAVWPNVAGMTAALSLLSTPPRRWAYCNRDRELGKYSTAGRWYLAPAELDKSKMAEHASTSSFSSVGTFLNESFLCGRFVLSPAAVDPDAHIADERCVFGSKMEDSSRASALALCDIVAVEPPAESSTHFSIYVFMTQTVRLHIDQLYVLTPRVVNPNMSKTLAALGAAAAAPQLTLLLESALSPLPALASHGSTTTTTTAAAAAGVSLLDAVAAVQECQPRQHAMVVTNVHRSFFESVSARPTTLLLGPPGSGKTRTLASMILGYCLQRRSNDGSASCPRRVLITAATHKALQQLHKELDESGNNLFARPALAGRVLVQRIVSAASKKTKQTAAGEVYESLGAVTKMAKPKRGAGDNSPASVVVLCTIWAASKLDKDAFDMLVFDEASQIQLVDAVSASMLLKHSADSRLVVGGDPLQLPPIVSDGLANNSNSAGHVNWCRLRSAESLRSGASDNRSVMARNNDDDCGDDNENDKNEDAAATFSLIASSVFDALLWMRESDGSKCSRFADIPRISQPSVAAQLLGLYQLPHSFRSTPEIVTIVRHLYPSFAVAPPRVGTSAPSSPSSSSPAAAVSSAAADLCRRGVVVTVIESSDDNRSAGDKEAAHIVQRIQAIRAETPSATIAVVTPRRHQRAKVRELLVSAAMMARSVAADGSQVETADDDQEETTTAAAAAASGARARARAPEIVVATTETMQGDAANAVFLAFADVRNARFALNVRRINVAISRAERYVELVISRSLMDTMCGGDGTIDQLEREDIQNARFSGKARAYIADSVKLLNWFAEVARQQEQHER